MLNKAKATALHPVIRLSFRLLEGWVQIPGPPANEPCVWKSVNSRLLLFVRAKHGKVIGARRTCSERRREPRHAPGTPSSSQSCPIWSQTMREHHGLASWCNGIGLFYETPAEKPVSCDQLSSVTIINTELIRMKEGRCLHCQTQLLGYGCNSPFELVPFPENKEILNTKK